ncbi:methyltransferase domain-containing protein [Methylorubrum salsuginis]|uniref:Methyltransferase domain-containing protein n=1 Tax=Methylorubrum salsuginis TaxID=414703 RepID=A0A1I4LR79_9HYPH|nr:methyltransferase domain-containing protein [Methylorubrum salsuginis]SFL93356.1 Methyltransferase domain-containing protein [Methylorubrum salsuginis]
MHAHRLAAGLAPSPMAIYGSRYRQKRLAGFLALVDAALAEGRRPCRVLDLGGETGYWAGLSDLWADRPLEITIVNRMPQAVPDERFAVRVGDACAMPEFGDRAFDVVHSNSVLEHVGSWTNKRRMAAEIRRLAPRYFVQTPNYWFPIEPHFRTPLFHWLPRPWQRDLLLHGRRGCFHRATSLDQADWMLNDSSLLDAREMRNLFPESRIVRERVAGLTKSLIALR